MIVVLVMVIRGSNQSKGSSDTYYYRLVNFGCVVVVVKDVVVVLFCDSCSVIFKKCSVTSTAREL